MHILQQNQPKPEIHLIQTLHYAHQYDCLTFLCLCAYHYILMYSATSIIRTPLSIG